MAVYSERPAIPRRMVYEVLESGELGDLREIETRGAIVREMSADIFLDLGAAQAINTWLSAQIKELKKRLARSRGVQLGNPNGAEALRRAGKGGAALRAAVLANAERHARDLAPVVADSLAGGATSLRAIADELNDRGMLTRRGGRWHVSTVINLLDGLELRKPACGSPG